MARRHGGPHSPGGAAPPRPFEGRRPVPMPLRSNILFLLPVPFAIRAFFAEPLVMALWLGSAGVLLLAAWLTREGLRAEDAFAARRISRPPAIPRKIFGGIAAGAGLALAGLAGYGPTEAAVFAVLGAGLHLAAFGADPLRAKGMETHGDFQSERVARVVDEAEKHLAEMRAAIDALGDRALTGRVDRFLITARRMCRTVEEDPRDLTGARRYLGVYLIGARDAATKFAELQARRRDPEARHDFEALLDDLEKTFAERTERMLTDDRMDLDVEIEVLRERLEREGVS